MDKAEGIETETRNIGIVNEVLTLLEQVVIGPPVASDGQHLACAFLQRHYIRQRNAGHLTLVILVLIAFKVQIDVHLQDLEAVIFRGSEAEFLSDLLLDLVHHLWWLTKV